MPPRATSDPAKNRRRRALGAGQERGHAGHQRQQAEDHRRQPARDVGLAGVHQAVAQAAHHPARPDPAALLPGARAAAGQAHRRQRGQQGDGDDEADGGARERRIPARAHAHPDGEPGGAPDQRAADVGERGHPGGGVDGAGVDGEGVGGVGAAGGAGAGAAGGGGAGGGAPGGGGAVGGGGSTGDGEIGPGVGEGANRPGGSVLRSGGDGLAGSMSGRGGGGASTGCASGGGAFVAGEVGVQRAQAALPGDAGGGWAAVLGFLAGGHLLHHRRRDGRGERVGQRRRRGLARAVVARGTRQPDQAGEQQVGAGPSGHCPPFSQASGPQAPPISRGARRQRIERNLPAPSRGAGKVPVKVILMLRPGAWIRMLVILAPGVVGAVGRLLVRTGARERDRRHRRGTGSGGSSGASGGSRGGGPGTGGSGAGGTGTGGRGGSGSGGGAGAAGAGTGGSGGGGAGGLRPAPAAPRPMRPPPTAAR